MPQQTLSSKHNCIKSLQSNSFGYLIQFNSENISYTVFLKYIRSKFISSCMRKESKD